MQAIWPKGGARENMCLKRESIYNGAPEGICICFSPLVAQGMGKRVPLDSFRIQNRGGMGLKSIKLNEGDRLAAVEVVRSASSSWPFQPLAPCMLKQRQPHSVHLPHPA